MASLEEKSSSTFSGSTASSSATSIAESTVEQYIRPSRFYKFVSYKLRDEYEKPWIADKRMKRTVISNYIIWGFLIASLLVSAFINWRMVKKIQNHDYCLVLDDQFSTFDTNTWNREVQVNGFGTGSFDWTTADSKNSFVDEEGLHIMPTLTTESTEITRDQIFNGYTLNLTSKGGDGSCTGSNNIQCSIASNGSTGAIIPPVRSARLNTRGKKSIRYGKIEIVAKFPTGDWLWPAIWMMPEDSVYGQWPASGEIDIAESRGNGAEYEMGGRDTFVSTLHWGPTSATDSYWRTTRGRKLRRTDFSKDFHTFGIEWSKDYLFTYIDSRLQQVFYQNFKTGQSMWDRGKFSTAVENSSLIENPWSHGDKNAPFDQKFYLIMNVAVGSRNGWFLDGNGNKPWTDTSNKAPAEFYRNIDQWYPTWGEGNSRGMTVKSVKMWQEGRCV